MSERTAAPPAAGAGKYLGLLLGGELYAVAVACVREIIERPPITRVPRTPSHVLGMINLRGKIVPVIDLRLKLGLPDDTPVARTRIVVVDVEGVRTGVVVDGVTDVLSIPAERIEAPPHLGGGVEAACVVGIAQVREQVFVVMDLERVLSAQDVVLLERARAGDGQE